MDEELVGGRLVLRDLATFAFGGLGGATARFSTAVAEPPAPLPRLLGFGVCCVFVSAS